MNEFEMSKRLRERGLYPKVEVHKPANKTVVLYTIVGRDKLLLLINALIDGSKWFIVEPYPDHTWCITVKNEPGLPMKFKWNSSPSNKE